MENTTREIISRLINNGRKPPKNIRKIRKEQHDEIRDKYVSGLSLNKISLIYGVSRERIRQILNKNYGITREDGGGRVAKIERHRIKAEEKKQKQYSSKLKIAKRNGFSSVEEFLAVPKSAREEYRINKTSAGQRHIPWDFLLKGWWDIWVASGKYDNRGVGMGTYQMERIDTTKGYSPDNVRIVSFEEHTNRNSHNRSYKYIKHQN